MSVKTLDKAIKAIDASKKEGFVIKKAKIVNGKLELVYKDLLYGSGKLETASFTKQQAKGFLKDPWNTYEGNTKQVIISFANA